MINVTAVISSVQPTATYEKFKIQGVFRTLQATKSQ